MELNKIYEGMALDVMRTFPDKSVNSIITSPPYWQLRDYGWTGQWGLEPTFQMYLENLWSLMDEAWRILKDDGTAWINLGDTYSTQSGSMGSGRWVDPKNPKATNTAFRQTPVLSVKNKCLLLIPHRFAIGCIDRGWIIRNDIIWAKPNGMPESVTDRFSKKHEYIFFMTKNEKYYFDLESVLQPLKRSSIQRLSQDIASQQGSKRANGGGKVNGCMKAVSKGCMGANPGSVSDFWDISTKPSKEKHYATYNTQLIDKPIISGCPKGGIILDPFCGTATTGCRAVDLQRKFIGIEGKPEYVKSGNKKLLKYIVSQQLF